MRGQEQMKSTLKKVLFNAILIAAIFISLPITTPLADTIGSIDMEAIFTRADMVKNFQKNMEKEKEKYQEFFEKKQEKLEKAKKKGKSDEEIQELIVELEEEILPRRQELAQLEAGFQQNLLKSIQRVSEEVAKELGIDVVVDNRVIFYGGFDMTGLVLDKLNQQN